MAAQDDNDNVQPLLSQESRAVRPYNPKTVITPVQQSRAPIPSGGSNTRSGVEYWPIEDRI